MKIIKRISIITASILAITLIVLSILGAKERVGYFTEFQLDELQPQIEENYNYHFRVRYYDKTFRNSDIYGVYAKTNNLPEYIKSVKFDEAGSPYGFILSDKELSFDDKIDNVGYVLKVKNLVVFCIILFVVFSCLFVYPKYIIKTCKLLINYFSKFNYVKILDISLPTILGVLVFVTVFYNLKNSGWIFGDDVALIMHHFLNIRLGDSRFFPLGYFHWYLLIPFGNNPFAYHVIISLLFIALVFFIYKLFLSISKRSFISFLFTVIFLLMPDITGYLYFQLVLTESIILPFIAIFILCYKKGTETNKLIYFIISGFICAYTTYCKEPIFGIFLVFALTNLIFNYKTLSKKQKYLLFFIILNAVIFLGLYAYLMRNATYNYADGRDGGIGRRGVFLYFLKTNYLFVFSFLVTMFRGFCILLKKDRKLLIYDAYLFSGVAYIFAFVFMKLYSSYYMTPSYVPIFIAFAGYVSYLINIPALVKNKNILCAFYILFTAIWIICFVNLFPKTIASIENSVRWKKESIAQTKLLLALEDIGYKIYMVFPENLNRGSLSVLNWYYRILHVFTSVEKHDGKYNKDYNIIKKITDNDEIYLSEKFLVYCGNENKFISNEMFNVNPTNYSYYPMWWQYGYFYPMYGKTNDIIEVEDMLNKIRATNK